MKNKVYFLLLGIMLCLACTKFPLPPSGDGNAVSVQTFEPNEITAISANVGGQVLKNGSSPILESGLVISTSPNLSITNSQIRIRADNNSYSKVFGLIPSTNYFVRYYSTTALTTFYGEADPINFITKTARLSTPSLTSPVNNASVRGCCLNFSWGGVSSASGYILQLSRNINFNGLYNVVVPCNNSSKVAIGGLNTSSVISGTNYCLNLSSSALNGVWYWRVAAIGGVESSNWSSIRLLSYAL